MCSFVQWQSNSDKIIMQFAQVNFDILICQLSQQSFVLIAMFYLKSPKAEISFLNAQMLFSFGFLHAGDRSGTKIN